MPKPVIATSSAKSEDSIQNIFFLTRVVQMKKNCIFIVEEENWVIDNQLHRQHFRIFIAQMQNRHTHKYHFMVSMYIKAILQNMDMS